MRTAGSSAGSQYGATVGITPRRSGPTSGSARRRAASLTASIASSARRARPTTSSPAGVTSTRAAIALEHLHAEQLLGGLDLRRQRGLRDAERGRRSAKAAVIGDRDEALELANRRAIHDRQHLSHLSI